ncbi:MAG: hypothetical protein QM699_06060 [Amaricoccus sp.]|uniref:hypothetical protein n=1 Tax=Amaricoccus sp. TaxID=1872485 RepID=UPI0039E5BA88
MADLYRFAGFTSPSRLERDPFLSREDKISGLATWRSMVERLADKRDADEHEQLMQEIDRAFARLGRSS